jgi:hypothetical protein
MKFDFESLSTEPLFYMLMHSGAFVCVLGFVFFIVGLLFGYATWGRYKRQTRQLLGEAESMKDEIAGLKRKVGDQSITSGPAVAMATETIHMPKKEGTTAEEAVPAVTAETITTSDIRLPTASTVDMPDKNQPPNLPRHPLKLPPRRSFIPPNRHPLNLPRPASRLAPEKSRRLPGMLRLLPPSLPLIRLKKNLRPGRSLQRRHSVWCLQIPFLS